MIKGHGDDTYRYADIRMNFSSNIPQHTDRSALKQYLTSQLDVIDNYPEPEAWSLEHLIARQQDVDPACVIVTNGATEAIYLMAQTFRLHHTIPAPTFSEYEDACRLFGPPQEEGCCYWLCNPNNPTGEVKNGEDVRELMSRYDLVVIDQSYEGYTDEPLLTAREAVAAGNVVQLHSMTKTYAVPGLRIGYIVAAPLLAEQLRGRLHPWSVNALAVEAGKWLIAHATPIRPDLEEARRLWHNLNAIPGIEMLPTRTNFMLGRLTAHHSLKNILARQHGILIRDASNFKGLTPCHFRVAAQSPQENNALVNAFNTILHA